MSFSLLKMQAFQLPFFCFFFFIAENKNFSSTPILLFISRLSATLIIHRLSATLLDYLPLFIPLPSGTLYPSVIRHFSLLNMQAFWLRSAFLYLCNRMKTFVKTTMYPLVYWPLLSLDFPPLFLSVDYRQLSPRQKLEWW